MPRLRFAGTDPKDMDDLLVERIPYHERDPTGGDTRLDS